MTPKQTVSRGTHDGRQYTLKMTVDRKQNKRRKETATLTKAVRDEVVVLLKGRRVKRGGLHQRGHEAFLVRLRRRLWEVLQ